MIGNVSEEVCRENKTHICDQKRFFGKSCRQEIMWKNNVDQRKV